MKTATNPTQATIYTNTALHRRYRDLVERSGLKSLTFLERLLSLAESHLDEIVSPQSVGSGRRRSQKAAS